MNFYINLEDVKAEMDNRKQVRLDVENWWKENGIDFPKSINGCGILGRNIMPRIEFFKFHKLCEQADIKPFAIEYQDDKFVSVSKSKMSMAKPIVLHKFSSGGMPIAKKNKTLVKDVSAFDGKATMGEIGLLRHHREAVKTILPNLLSWDMSQAVKIWKKKRLYYQGYLSLAVAHGVLFEDYHNAGESGNKLSNFTERVFEPAFEWLENKFGVGPMLVALPWKKDYRLHLSREILQQMYVDGKTLNFNPIERLL